MPNYPTLLDIARRNAADPVVGLIDETVQIHPELTLGAARTIKGINYQTLVRTALGNVAGSFRSANAGVAAHKHTYENRMVETYILNPIWMADRAVADRSEDGWQAYLANEAVGTMEGEMQAICKQFYYGTGTNGNASGFPGLIQSYDATNMVVDAGGTTADTGSSVWLIKFGQQHVQWVWGENGSLQMADVRTQLMADPNDSTKQLEMYIQSLLAYPGLAVHSLRSVCRIKKLTADSGKGLTDALIYDALSKFQAGIRPDVILATRRSLKQLRASRTATNQTGAPAPLPTEVEGIPIYPTDAIVDTEALTL